MAETQHTHIEAELSRDIGLITALAIGVGTMIAAGIFSLSGLAIKNVGSAAILSFLIAALVALFTALTYCEFVSIYPNSGEGYLYARKTFPRRSRFSSAGRCFWVTLLRAVFISPHFPVILSNSFIICLMKLLPELSL